MAIEDSFSSSTLSLSETCSQSAFNVAKKTFQSRKQKWGEAAPTLDHYYCQLLKTPTHTLAIASDGIGTKIELAERCGKYSTLGYDLIAMIADDIICSGAEPTHLSNILDVDKLDSKIFNELFSGLQKAAEEAQIMITGGETAELGNRIGGYGSGMHFNWCATGIGILENGKKPIDGSDIQSGDAVIALHSPGLRSNGFSLARKTLQKRFGDEWHNEPFHNSKITWCEQLLTPCLIYSPHILYLLEKQYPLRGVAHITGGGVAANLERILTPWKKGAELTSLYAPNEEMKCLQEWASLSDRESYETWNMANGMLLVLPQQSVAKVLEELKERKIEAKLAGVINEDSAITIHSQAKEGAKLRFIYE